jgi:hypothetical protein
MATYYIEIDTYWQNSKSHFVGPFETREQAEAWHQNDDWTPADNTWLSTSQCGGDIRTAWRICPKALSETEARKHGMRRYEDRDETDNTISPSTRPSAPALDAAVSEEVY